MSILSLKLRTFLIIGLSPLIRSCGNQDTHNLAYHISYVMRGVVKNIELYNVVNGNYPRHLRVQPS